MVSLRGVFDCLVIGGLILLVQVAGEVGSKELPSFPPHCYLWTVTFSWILRTLSLFPPAWLAGE